MGRFLLMISSRVYCVIIYPILFVLNSDPLTIRHQSKAASHTQPAGLRRCRVVYCESYDTDSPTPLSERAPIITHCPSLVRHSAPLLAVVLNYAKELQVIVSALPKGRPRLRRQADLGKCASLGRGRAKPRKELRLCWKIASMPSASAPMRFGSGMDDQKAEAWTTGRKPRQR